MFFKSKLKEIEEKISAIQKNGIADSENVGNSANARKAKRETETAALKTERGFILDRRNSWKQKLFWHVGVAIVVALITAYVVTKYIGA